MPINVFITLGSDRYFLYVLKTLGGIELGTWERSERADILKTIGFTWDSYTVFEERLLGGIAEKPELIRKPPLPFIRDGRPLLGEYATLTDPDTGLKYSGGITAAFHLRQFVKNYCVH